MRTEFKKLFFVLAAILCLSAITLADWDPGDLYKMHFPQLPNPDGWDICLHEQMIADDFMCIETGAITDIHFWVSWQSDMEDWANTTFQVQIWSDIPGGPCGGGMPGVPLWTWNGLGNFVVRMPPYVGNEGWHCPATGLTIRPDHYMFWQINITDIPDPFIQEIGTTYWLVIKANKQDWPPAVGWKTSLNRFQSCSLWSSGTAAWMPVLAGGETVDQAFVITSTTPEPNEPNIPNTKYVQWPDLTSTGIDIRVDDADGVTRHIADDFPCNTPGLITDVHFWGSWKNDIKGQISSVVVSFYSDDPVGLGGTDPNNQFSKPDQLLWQKTYQTVDINESLYRDLGQEYEWWWDPYFNDLLQYGDHLVWKYDINIDPNIAFHQEGTPTNLKVYWLALEVRLPYQGEYKFGWKTSREHWNDDAVFATGSIPPYIWNELRYPLGHPYHPESLDMAFAITTGAEPNIPEDPNLKYLQPPDLTETGVDVRFDRSDGILRTLADDFPCTSKGRITGVKLWGSWLNDIKGKVNLIHLSIHSDIPASQSPTGYSMPGDLLWQRDIMPIDFNEVLQANIAPFFESWWDPYMSIFLPYGDQNVWRYDIRIPWSYAFEQKGEPNNPKVYWLDAWAMISNIAPGDIAMFGWKSSRIHWNDDAVWRINDANWIEMRYPLGHQYFPQSMDLAFEIRTEPECYAGMSDYAQWVDAGKPECWCYPRQCHGDADGRKQGDSKNGYYYVGSNDLTILTNAWKIKNSPKGPGLSGIQGCGDFDHLKQGDSKNGYYRVGSNDLTILTTFWKVKESPKGPGVSPNCLPGNRNP